MAVAVSRASIRQACIEHMLDSLASAKPATDPYPHFWQQGFFPSAIYERLLHWLPRTEDYQGGAEYSSPNATVKPIRFTFPLLTPQLQKLKPEPREFWLGVRDALGAPALKRAVFQKLAAGLSYRFNVPAEQAAEIEAYPNPILFRELSGYSIKPHPDTRRKIVTFQIALPADDRQRDLGTSLYQLSLNPRHLLEEPRGFQRVGRYPFVPNSVFAFSVVNSARMRSWHGRETLPANCGERNSLLLVYYARAEDANPEIAAEHFSAPRRAA